MSHTEYIHYDEGIDHLVIYKSGEQIESNLDLGLAILSFNKEKEIIGIELMGVHHNFKIPLEALQDIQGCNVEIRYNPSQKMIVITVTLQYQEMESPLVWSHAGVDLGSAAFSESFACSTA
ncbi:DUF2283 domain-containing protein [Candidatus Woesearchaeota archaeon]|nr:DUF2283 domain-containing protein [Candidatus Woesearchaeota archaeon]